MTARKPPKRKRAAALRAAGWIRIGGASGSQTWQHPRYPRSHFFTLAAAELDEARQTGPDEDAA